ncbi:MAG: hypothetical protein HS108_02990 [Planctomycetes bacterium]|nr:hypothetical protein [Planctomycetota bacterium]
MDETEFRRLCVDALEGRLDEPTRRQWEQLRLADPEFADFYNRVAMAHRALSTRLASTGVSVAGRPPRISPRWFWLLALLAALVGALAGALGMDSWIRHDRNARAAQAAQALPAPAAGNTLAPVNRPAGGTPRPEAAAPANQPVAPGPVLKPDPKPAPKPEPEPEPEPWFVLTRAEDTDARVLRPGANEYAEAAPGAGFWGGYSLRLGRGSIELSGGDCRLVLSGRAELEILGPRSLRLLRGRLALRVLADGLALRCEGAELRLATGDFVCTSLRGLAEIAVVAGRLDAELGDDRASVGRGTLLELARGLPEQRLDAQAAGALAAECAAMTRRVLWWHFEDGPGDCDEGAVVEGGLDGGHALQLDPTRPGAGSGRFEPLFAARGTMRLRAWELTDAASIEISARAHLAQGIRRVGMKVPLPAGSGWRMIDVDLSGLRGGRHWELPGWVEGANYSGLQFSVPPQPQDRLRSFALRVDDVEIYALR